MTYGELKRRLRRLGVVVDRQGARHELWLNPATQRRAAIPRHDQREVPAGMLHGSFKSLASPEKILSTGRSDSGEPHTYSCRHSMRRWCELSHRVLAALPFTLLVLLVGAGCSRGWMVSAYNSTDEPVLVYDEPAGAPLPSRAKPAGFGLVPPGGTERFGVIDSLRHRTKGIRIEAYRTDGQRIMCRWLAPTQEAIENNPDVPFQRIPPPGAGDVDVELVFDPGSCDPRAKGGTPQ